MRHGRRDLNVRSCRQLDGGDRHPPIFENFSIRHIFLKFYFFNIKMKKRSDLEGPWARARFGPLVRWATLQI